MSTPEEVRQQRRQGVHGIDLLMHEKAEERKVPIPPYEWDSYGRNVDNLDDKGARITITKGKRDKIEVQFSGEELEDFPAQPHPETITKIRRIVSWCGSASSR